MRSVLALAVVAAVTAPVAAQNLTVLGRVDLTGQFSDGLFVHDNLVFFLSDDGQNLLYIYDATDPTNPVQVTKLTLRNARIPDMHGIYYSNGLLYVGLQGSGGGLSIFDLADPANPVELSWTPIPGSGVHTLRLADGILYIMNASGSEADVLALDVSDPRAPIEVGQWDLGGSYCHDMSVMRDIGYASLWDDGIYLLDLRDPSNIVPITSHTAGGDSDNMHSIWPGADGRTIVTCQEARNQPVRIFDVGGTVITQLSTWESHENQPDTIAHDVMIVGNFAYLSYYVDGARVVDISDPTAPVQVASLLTGNDCGAGLFCNAVAQWVENGLFYLLDLDNGLWILRFDLPHDVSTTLYAVKANGGQDVAMRWSSTGESQYTVRQRLQKDSLQPHTKFDVDGEVDWIHRGVVPDGNLYYYTINGPWR